MGYNPKVKNLPELIQDLVLLADGEMTISTLEKKMNILDYQNDSIDGFEDVLDALRPFIKELSMISEITKNTKALIKLRELIDGLRKELRLEKLKRIRFNRK